MSDVSRSVDKGKSGVFHCFKKTSATENSKTKSAPQSLVIPHASLTPENIKKLNLPADVLTAVLKLASSDDSPDKPRRVRWTHAATVELIRLFKENFALFQNTTSNDETWGLLTYAMAKKGFRFTGIQMRYRFHNLKKLYMNGDDFPYYNDFKELYPHSSKRKFNHLEDENESPSKISKSFDNLEYSSDEYNDIFNETATSEPAISDPLDEEVFVENIPKVEVLMDQRPSSSNEQGAQTNNCCNTDRIAEVLDMFREESKDRFDKFLEMQKEELLERKKMRVAIYKLIEKLV